MPHLRPCHLRSRSRMFPADHLSQWMDASWLTARLARAAQTWHCEFALESVPLRVCTECPDLLASCITTGTRSNNSPPPPKAEQSIQACHG